MTLEEIEACIGLMERYGVEAFSVSRGGETLALRGALAASPRPAATQAPGRNASVTAPAPGVFRAAHPADGERLAPEGVTVRAGQVVALLQVGPCLRAVTAAEAGVIGAPLVADGALVGFGALLFDLRADA